ncbi:MAG: 30S ribosomal protein S6 [Gemmataceae bacterium]
MPANVYECMFILDTNTIAGDLSAVSKQLHTLLERNQAEVLASRPWGEQKLAYPIKNQKKGLYYLIYFRTEGKNLADIERDLSLNESILRNMIIRIETKLVDIMLQVAHDERALALQTVNAPPPEDDLGFRDDSERGPRRPSRRAAAMADQGEDAR